MTSDQTSPARTAHPGVWGRAWTGFCRRWPFIRGRDRFMRISSSNLPIRQMLLSRSEWVTTREGVEMKIGSEFDYTSFMLRLFGNLEPTTGRFILNNMKDGETFLDIGANVGYFALLVASELRQAHVVAFEPNPPIELCLSESVQRNGLGDRMKVVRKAVSNVAGAVSFAVEAINSGHSRIATGASTSDVIQVDAVIFDDWVKVNPLSSRVACIKMDVEGAEVLALKGMSELLAKHRPALCIEGYDNQLAEFGSSLAELRKLLLDAGYHEVAPFDGNLYLKHREPPAI